MSDSDSPQKTSSSLDHAKHRAYALETTGLLIIAVVILLLTLLRYWHNFHWSIR